MPFLLQNTSPLRGLWKIEESSQELLNLLEIHEDDLPELKGFKKEKRKQEWLATRLLLKTLWQNNDSSDIPSIEYHSSGSPFLLNDPRYISISHTTGYAALLIQSQPFAGIDIEARGDRVIRVRDRFLSKEENSSIDSFHTADHLLIYWCAKEVLFKMLREENVDFIDHLHIEPFSYSESGVLQGYETHSAHKHRFKLGYQVLRDFIWVWSPDASGE